MNSEIEPVSCCKQFDTGRLNMVERYFFSPTKICIVDCLKKGCPFVTERQRKDGLVLLNQQMDRICARIKAWK